MYTPSAWSEAFNILSHTEKKRKGVEEDRREESIWQSRCRSMRVEAVGPECNKGVVHTADNLRCVCAGALVCARMSRPRLLSLIDPARRPFDLQDISEPADAAGGGEMAGEMSGKKREGGVERKYKISGAESCMGHLAG